MIILISLAVAGGGRKLDLKKYYYINVEGFNNYATATIERNISNNQDLAYKMMADVCGSDATDYSKVISFNAFFHQLNSTELNKKI